MSQDIDLSIEAPIPQVWDEFIIGSTSGHFMQSYAWGQFQGASGWRPHYLTFYQGPQVVARCLLLSRKVPFSTFHVFYCPRGFPRASEPSVLDDSLFAALQKYVRSKNGVFVRFDPYEAEAAFDNLDSSGSNLLRVPREWSYWNAPKFVFWLDINGNEDEILQSMSKVCRSDVRSGYRKGVTFELGTSTDISDFYRLLVQTSNLKGIAVHDADYYQRLFDLLQLSCEVGLVMAKLGNEAVATGMSIRYGSTAWLMYAASDRAHFKLRVNRTVQWEMIKWAKERGCTRYDFRGTATGDPPDPNDPGYGVYEFKRSFGPTFTRLAGYFDIPCMPRVYSLFRLAEERALPALYNARTWLDARRARRSSGSAGGEP